MWNKEQAVGGFIERAAVGKGRAGDADLSDPADDPADGGAQLLGGGIGRAGIERKVALRTLFADRLDPGKTLMA